MQADRCNVFSPCSKLSKRNRVQAKPYECYWVTAGEVWDYQEASDHVLVRPKRWASLNCDMGQSRSLGDASPHTTNAVRRTLYYLFVF